YLEEEEPHWTKRKYLDTTHRHIEANGHSTQDFELEDVYYKEPELNEEQGTVDVCAKGQEYVVPLEDWEEFVKVAPLVCHTRITDSFRANKIPVIGEIA